MMPCLSLSAMMSGELPPAYLVYSTGTGFMPNIEGIPQAMKGLGTIFMLALLTGNNNVAIHKL